MRRFYEHYICRIVITGLLQKKRVYAERHTDVEFEWNMQKEEDCSDMKFELGCIIWGR